MYSYSYVSIAHFNICTYAHMFQTRVFYIVEKLLKTC
nr:MAG TPA: hypothetical protein [Bacteriophage sp.]